MKKTFVSLICFFVFSASAFALDSYEQLADDMVKYGEGLKKIAIIQFSYAESTSSTKDGSVISERLSMKLINKRKFEIIERSVLNKVLDELKLQNSGAIDATSAKELGKVLGVDAIITGTLVPTSDGKIEVNARIIKTETAQAVGASQVYVTKDWLGGDTQVVAAKPQPVYEPPQQYAQSKVTAAPYVRGQHEYGFFDIMLGMGSQTVDLKWDNGNTIDAMTATGAGPIGIRVGGFGKNIVGGDFEFSVSKHYIEKQIAFLNDSIALNIPDGLFDVTSISMSGDLLFRTLTKAQFYLGIGLGFSINNIKSEYVLDKSARPLNETSLGFMFRIPLGLRFTLDNMTFFTEYRAEINSTSFDRGTLTENNTLTFNGSRFVFGLGSRF